MEQSKIIDTLETYQPPCRGRGESPSEIGFVSLSLSVSAFCFLALHRFLNSRRSVTLIGLNFGHNLYPDISFIEAKEGIQPPYGVATRAQGTPAYVVAPSGIVSH